MSRTKKITTLFQFVFINKIYTIVNKIDLSINKENINFFPTLMYYLVMSRNTRMSRKKCHNFLTILFLVLCLKKYIKLSKNSFNHKQRKAEIYFLH